MEDQEIQAIIDREGVVWLHADDMIRNFKAVESAYRDAASKSPSVVIKMKFLAFADAIEAERKDLELTIERGKEQRGR